MTSSPSYNGKGLLSIIATVIGAALVLAISSSWEQIAVTAERSARNEEKIENIMGTMESMSTKLDTALEYIYSHP